jgi:hypothetical protein
MITIFKQLIISNSLVSQLHTHFINETALPAIMESLGSCISLMTDTNSNEHDKTENDLLHTRHNQFDSSPYSFLVLH